MFPWIHLPFPFSLSFFLTFSLPSYLFLLHHPYHPFIAVFKSSQFLSYRLHVCCGEHDRPLHPPNWWQHKKDTNQKFIEEIAVSLKNPSLVYNNWVNNVNVILYWSLKGDSVCSSPDGDQLDLLATTVPPKILEIWCLAKGHLSMPDARWKVVLIVYWSPCPPLNLLKCRADHWIWTLSGENCVLMWIFSPYSWLNTEENDSVHHQVCLFEANDSWQRDRQLSQGLEIWSMCTLQTSRTRQTGHKYVQKYMQRKNKILQHQRLYSLKAK